MTHAIITLLSIAMILTGTLTLVGSSCAAIDQVSQSNNRMMERTAEMARTRISKENVEVSGGGAEWKVTLKNLGQTALTDFSRWDVVVQYYGTDRNYYVKRLPYTAGSPGSNEWTMDGIFEDAQSGKAEVFEPGVLNPGEEVKIRIKLMPPVHAQKASWVIIATANGVAVKLML